MRIGIFGGTFDPIHLGHLQVAEEVLEKKHLDRILFIPAGCPPHRRMPSVPPERRLAMVEQAIKKNRFFMVSDYEIKKKSKSYTVETLRFLSEKYPKDMLYLIIGADQWLTFPQWYQADEILELAKVVVMSRPNIEPAQVENVIQHQLKPDLMTRVKLINVSKLDISSTDIRRRLRHGLSVRYLLTSQVADYITHYQLYI